MPVVRFKISNPLFMATNGATNNGFQWQLPGLIHHQCKVSFFETDYRHKFLTLLYIVLISARDKVSFTEVQRYAWVSPLWSVNSARFLSCTVYFHCRCHAAAEQPVYLSSPDETKHVQNANHQSSLWTTHLAHNFTTNQALLQFRKVWQILKQAAGQTSQRVMGQAPEERNRKTSGHKQHFVGGNYAKQGWEKSLLKYFSGEHLLELSYADRFLDSSLDQR